MTKDRHDLRWNKQSSYDLRGRPYPVKLTCDRERSKWFSPLKKQHQIKTITEVISRVPGIPLSVVKPGSVILECVGVQESPHKPYEHTHPKTEHSGPQKGYGSLDVVPVCPESRLFIEKRVQKIKRQEMEQYNILAYWTEYCQPAYKGISPEWGKWWAHGEQGNFRTLS